MSSIVLTAVALLAGVAALPVVVQNEQLIARLDGATGGLLSLQGRDSGAPAFVFTDDNWELTVATTGPVLTLAPANCSTSAQRTQQPVHPPAAATVTFTCSGADVSFRVEATYRLPRNERVRRRRQVPTGAGNRVGWIGTQWRRGSAPQLEPVHDEASDRYVCARCRR